MKDAKLILRQLYQHIQVKANLPGLLPRPLLSSQMLPGSSEFSVSAVVTTPGGGMSAGGLVVRCTYSGFVAAHYRVDTNPGDLTPDEAALNAALEGFRLNPAVQTPGFVNFGGFSTNFSLTEFPEKTGQSPVLTLSVDWDLTLDLETGVQL
ncbi:hypothetical protein Q0M94_02175 [Deinococcus radiomollis]|uniref:hypothetical protein n=1 Tax=Deinococcus radiomollis TaxID=468916 RepID=UPI003891A1EB